MDTLIASSLDAALEMLGDQIAELRAEVLRLRKERDDLRHELERQYHVWTRDDLDEWAKSRGITITDELWTEWCVSWDTVYSVLDEREVMTAAMEDWWRARMGS
jgi:hypothetical protein